MAIDFINDHQDQCVYISHTYTTTKCTLVKFPDNKMKVVLFNSEHKRSRVTFLIVTIWLYYRGNYQGMETKIFVNNFGV